MFCNHCGNPLTSGDHFCNCCGKPSPAVSRNQEGGRTLAASGSYTLNPEEFICPSDHAAMQKLLAMGELNRLIRTFVEKYGKPWLESEFLGNGIKVGPTQFPQLFELAQDLGEIFCLPRLPDIYVINFLLTPMSIARANRSCTIGTESESFILLDVRYLAPVLDSGKSLDEMRRSSIYLMLAHEISHVALGHALYLSLCLWITESGPTGLAGLAVRPLVLPLLYWARQAVLSADRGVLVATGHYDEYRETLLSLLLGNSRLVKALNVEAYIGQLARIDEGTGRHNETLSNTSPYLSRRITAMDDYIREITYQGLRTRVDEFLNRIRSE